MSTCKSLLRVIPKTKLFESEPDPRWFGNGPNPGYDPAWTNGNWLKSRFHFSFAEYHNPQNSSFGVLRVMNDDLVQPKRGFGTHGHGNMEIITYIVNGKLTHEDSMGNGESLGRGSIQFMTAGTGVRHSEFNHGEKPLRFIQTWIVPERNGLKPNYGGYDAKGKLKKNTINHLASSVKNSKSDTPVKVNQDVNCYAAEIELERIYEALPKSSRARPLFIEGMGHNNVHSLVRPMFVARLNEYLDTKVWPNVRGAKISKSLPFGDESAGRQAYLLCIEGSLKVNGEALTRHDGCEIHGNGEPISIEAIGVEETENGKVAHFLMFEMKDAPGSGRKDI